MFCSVAFNAKKKREVFEKEGKKCAGTFLNSKGRAHGGNVQFLGVVILLV